MENLKSQTKKIFEHFNKMALYDQSYENEFEIREGDLYFFDPQEEIPTALGRMGDGWVILIEDYNENLFEEKKEELKEIINIENLFLDDNKDICYADEDYPEYIYIILTGSQEWQVVNQGESAGNYTYITKAIECAEDMIEKN